MMKIICISPEKYNECRDDLDEMYRLQAEWMGEGIKDQYDECNTYYLIYKNEDDQILGSVRLKSMMDRCFLSDNFESLFPKHNLKTFKKSWMWEISHFWVNADVNEEMLRDIFIALDLFAQDHDIEMFVTASYPSLHQLYIRYFDDISSRRSSNERFPDLILSVFKPKIIDEGIWHSSPTIH